VGQPGIQRGHPDYFPFYVGNHVLGGGGFASRLMDEVREQRGLAYSVSSYFVPSRRPGPFAMVVQTRNDQAAEAADLMKATLRGFRDEGPEASELEDARRNLTGGFPLRIDSNGEIVQNVATIGFYDLPLDYLAQFIGHVDDVDAKAIVEAFRRNLDPDRLVTVMVGGGGG
jgi:zinc protease